MLKMDSEPMPTKKRDKYRRPPPMDPEDPIRITRTIPYMLQVKIEVTAGIDGCDHNEVVQHALENFFAAHEEKQCIDSLASKRFKPRAQRRQINRNPPAEKK
jgi:hypothetical protein